MEQKIQKWVTSQSRGSVTRKLQLCTMNLVNTFAILSFLCLKQKFRDMYDKFMEITASFFQLVTYF